MGVCSGAGSLPCIHKHTNTMSIYSTPTVKIINPRKPGDYRLINESDYDPAVDTLWKDSGEQPESPMPDPAPGIQSKAYGSEEAEALAAEHGLPTQAMTGTGHGGKILLRDVRAAISQG